MKYLLFILIFLVSCKDSPEVKTDNPSQVKKDIFLINKTFRGVTAMTCEYPAPGATGCFSTHYFIEINFKNNYFVAQNFVYNCGEITLLNTQKGKWKVVDNQVVFSPDIFDSDKKKLNIFIVENQKGKIFGINDYGRIDFYLK